MNKKVIIFSTLSAFTLLPAMSLAQGLGIKNPIEADSLTELISAVVKAVRYVAIPFIVLAIMYSGWLFILAQGRAEKLTAARNTLQWVLLGAFIVLSAELISTIIAATLK